MSRPEIAIQKRNLSIRCACVLPSGNRYSLGPPLRQLTWIYPCLPYTRLRSHSPLYRLHSCNLTLQPVLTSDFLALASKSGKSYYPTPQVVLNLSRSPLPGSNTTSPHAISLADHQIPQTGVHTPHTIPPGPQPGSKQIA